MYIVAFNGPPRAGKDTMSSLVAKRIEEMGYDIPLREVSLSTPLRRIAYGMVGWHGVVLEGGHYENFKTSEFPQFERNGRELMIDVSEKFLKTQYGDTIMAQLLLAELANFPGIVLVRDCGFQAEVDRLAQAVGEKNLCLVKVERPFCTFEGDSRGWVSHSQVTTISNRWGVKDLEVEAAHFCARMVDKLGWKL